MQRRGQHFDISIRKPPMCPWFDYSQADIPVIRNKLVLEIEQGKLFNRWFSFYLKQTFPFVLL